MLHYRIHGFLRMGFLVRICLRASMKTQLFAKIWKEAFAPFAPSNKSLMILPVSLMKNQVNQFSKWDNCLLVPSQNLVCRKFFWYFTVVAIKYQWRFCNDAPKIHFLNNWFILSVSEHAIIKRNTYMCTIIWLFYPVNRGAFRTQSDIYGRAFLRKW